MGQVRIGIIGAAGAQALAGKEGSKWEGHTRF